MAERKKIGVVFSHDPEWIAGTYYIVNLVSALKSLPEDQRPHLTLFATDTSSADAFRQICSYPYISIKIVTKRETSGIKGFIDRFAQTVVRRRFFDKRASNRSVDMLFPAIFHDFFSTIPAGKQLFWIPDFQEHFFPHFFAEDEIARRLKRQAHLVKMKCTLVFSSQSARNHFREIYPDATNPFFVLPFAVSHDERYRKLDFAGLRVKYNLPAQFFFCANQFWKHKNHMLLIKAMKVLKDRGVLVNMIMSGKPHDYRNPGYFEQLRDLIEEYKLTEQVFFVGFIDRDEQLRLMAEAEAVIQPSLFEGWSTVVEDAKAMSQKIILSDLPVHREQIAENVLFFNPHDETELASRIEEMRLLQRKTIFYGEQIREFAQNFMKVADQLSESSLKTARHV